MTIIYSDFFFHLDWLGSQGHIITLPSACLGFFLVIASRFREFAARQKTTKGERGRGGEGGLLWLCVIVCGAQFLVLLSQWMNHAARRRRRRGQGRENNARADLWQILHCSDSHELTGRMNEGWRGGRAEAGSAQQVDWLIDWSSDGTFSACLSVWLSVCLSVCPY